VFSTHRLTSSEKVCVGGYLAFIQGLRDKFSVSETVVATLQYFTHTEYHAHVPCFTLLSILLTPLRSCLWRVKKTNKSTM